MTYSVPPPERPQIKKAIAAMKRGTDLFVKAGKPNSVKAIASRLSENGRRYQTARENGGVRVWRLA